MPGEFGRISQQLLTAIPNEHNGLFTSSASAKERAK